jgi:hypothetical protein
MSLKLMNSMQSSGIIAEDTDKHSLANCLGTSMIWRSDRRWRSDRNEGGCEAVSAFHILACRMAESIQSIQMMP